MPAPAADLVPGKRGGQPEAVGQLRQQRRAGMADHPDPVGGDFDAGRAVASLHPQGALLDHGYDLRTAVSSLVRRALSQSSPGHQPPHEKPRLVRVETPGLEPQERTVSGEQSERVERFVLGPPGMPFYYRGTG